MKANYNIRYVTFTYANHGEEEKDLEKHRIFSLKCANRMVGNMSNTRK